MNFVDFIGLSPNNIYRVSVRVKPGKLLYNDEKNPKKLEMLVSNVEFRTLPKGKLYHLTIQYSFIALHE